MFLVVGLTVLDIVVVEGYYRPRNAWSTINQYHVIWDMLYLATGIVAAILLRHPMPFFTISVGFAFGLEDTLYYLLQDKLPTIYTGINILWFSEPTRFTVLALNVFAIALVLVSTGIWQHSED